MRTFTFLDHGKDGAKKIETKISPFQPYNFRIWTFAFKVRVTTDLKLKETERIKKYYDTLNEEVEEALERKAGDHEVVLEIQSK